jgi:hypothetical protein
MLGNLRLLSDSQSLYARQKPLSRQPESMVLPSIRKVSCPSAIQAIMPRTRTQATRRRTAGPFGVGIRPQTSIMQGLPTEGSREKSISKQLGHPNQTQTESPDCSQLRDPRKAIRNVDRLTLSRHNLFSIHVRGAIWNKFRPDLGLISAILCRCSRSTRRSPH